MTDLQLEMDEQILIIPFENGAGMTGSWQQCSQP
jgi:hypothetical protein